MKKIGILTYFWGENVGTVLQAYSTLSLLKGRFNNEHVEIINYQPKEIKIKYIWNFLHFKKVIRYFSDVRVFNSFREHNLNIDSRPLITKDYSRAVNFVTGKFDIIIVGSDTVWEIETLELKNLAPFPNIYWIPSEISAKKVAFSVSSGTTTSERLDDKTLGTMRAVANDFDLIGIRDDITEKLVQDLGIEDPDRIIRTPDPTFTYKIGSTKIRQKLERIGIDLERPIAGINLPSIHELPAIEGFRSKIIEYLRSNGFQVLVLNNITGDKGVFTLPSVTPFEWAELFKYLTISITDRFHGAIFALKNLTPVIAIDCQTKRFTAEGDSKTRSLLKEFDLDTNFHFNINDIEMNQDLLFQCIDEAHANFDKVKVERKLAEMEMRCSQFVDKIEMLL